MIRGMLIILAMLFPVVSASAQSINRRIVALTMMPTGPEGEIEEYLVYAIDGSTPAQTDASTIIELLYLGEHVSSEQIDITLEPTSGCTPGSVCGQALYNGVPLDRICAKDQRCIGQSCATECQLLVWAFVPPRVQGISGYSIRVQPAAGAEPDAVTNDDEIAFPFTTLVAWDRSVRSLRANDINHDGVIESVSVTWRFSSKDVPPVAGVTSIDYSARVEVSRNSTLVSSAIGEAQFAPNTNDPCTRACPLTTCGVTNAGGALTTCVPNSIFNNCACGADIATIVPSPSTPFVPGEVITVTLVPAPGAVLESEYLLANDTKSFAIPSPCGGDANGDFVCNAADLSVLLGQFGEAVPYPYTGADYNGDGVVNNSDLSVLLSSFGNDCVP